MAGFNPTYCVPKTPLAAALVFIGLAWTGARVVGLSQAVAADDHTPGAHVGTLVGREARVMVFASQDGTRYEVRRHDGSLVGANLTAEQAAWLAPEQDPRGAWADEPASGPALMLAEPSGWSAYGD
jgi:hypothetical protein